MTERHLAGYEKNKRAEKNSGMLQYNQKPRPRSNYNAKRIFGEHSIRDLVELGFGNARYPAVVAFLIARA